MNSFLTIVRKNVNIFDHHDLEKSCKFLAYCRIKKLELVKTTYEVISLLLIGSFFLLLLLLAAPLRLEIQAAHRQKWEGTLNVQYLMIKHTFLLKKSSVKERDVEVKFDWKQTLEAVWKVIKFSTKRIFVRKCHLDCAIGFAQPTYTAYAYGFVWMVLSILPEWWQENLEVDYIPVFDQPVQKIDFHCIINAPLGNLILITGYVLWLIAREYWQHKERERLAYEG